MNLSVSTQPPEHWSRSVDELDGTIYHTEAWADISATSHSRPRFFTWTDPAGAVSAVALGTEQWSHLPVVGRRLKRLDFDTYPAVTDTAGDALPSTLADLVDVARREGSMAIQIGSFMAPRPVPEMADLGLDLHPRIEFVVDLTRAEDELMSDFSSHHRRKLRKALKQDLELREAANLDAVQDFRRLQVASRDRRLERGEDIGVLEDSYYEDLGRKYFRHDLGRVFLAVQDDEPVSAAFVSIHGGRALYVYGGSSDAGFGMDAPAFLFWSVFDRCRELGCTEFNLGGVPGGAEERGHPSHGLYRFKAGFGGTQVDCLSGSADDLRPGLARLKRMVDRIRS